MYALSYYSLITLLLYSYLKGWNEESFGREGAKSLFDICIAHFIIFADFARNWDIMDCEEIKKQRGGRREGAGRPKGRQQALYIPLRFGVRPEVARPYTRRSQSRHVPSH